MSKIYKVFILIFLFVSLNGYTLPVTTKYCDDVLSYGNPSLDATIKIARPNLYLCRDGYVSAYSYKLKQPIWVAYFLPPQQIKIKIKRDDNFKSDPDVPKDYSATINDYKKSGYDKGHMAPYASIAFNKQSADQSFYLSNISPQKAGLNRHGWAKLESKVRFWSVYYKGVYVITGGIYKNKKVHNTIGNDVAIPNYFYKIIYAPNKHSPPRTIAFVMPNSKVNRKDIAKYRVSIDNIEDRTGLTFLGNIKNINTSAVSKMWI